MKTKIIILLIFTSLLSSCNNIVEEKKDDVNVKKDDVNVKKEVLTEDLESSDLWGGNWIPTEIKESRK